MLPKPLAMNFSNDFLLWKDPVKTGSVFAGLNLIAFIILFCSPVLTFAYMGLALMCIGMILTSTSPGLGPKVPDEIVTAEQTQASRGWLPDSRSVEVQKGGFFGW